MESSKKRTPKSFKPYEGTGVDPDGYVEISDDYYYLWGDGGREDYAWEYEEREDKESGDQNVVDKLG